MGGAVNHVTVAKATTAGADAVTAALAPENFIVALYLILLHVLARNVSQLPLPAAAAAAEGRKTLSFPAGVLAVADEDLSPALASLTLRDAAVALSISAAMVAVATLADVLLPFALGSIPVVKIMSLGSARVPAVL